MIAKFNQVESLKNVIILAFCNEIIFLPVTVLESLGFAYLK